MKLQSKRVYEEPAGDDGYRVLVDRLWPRGLTREEARVDLWLKEIAPSTGLRKWFGHDPGKWASFRKKYREELSGNSAAVMRLKECLQKGTVTLLYAARDTRHNQAQVLREWISAEMS